MENINEIALEDLKKSGLNEDTIKDMGCFSVPRGAKKCIEWLKENLGFSKRGGHSIPQTTQDILAFPYPCEEYTRVRMYPQLEDAKYLAAKNSGTHLYYLKRDEKKLRKNSIPIIFNEGEKKTACVAQFAGEKFLSLGASGITQWKNCPEWKQIPLKGRDVYIAFDSRSYEPGERNPGLEKQILSLWLWLWKKRAIPKLMYWDAEHEKIDDWLCAVNQTKESSCLDAIKSSVNESEPNVFNELKNIDEDYFSEQLAKHDFTKEDITILWDKYNVKKKTSVNKTTAKSMLSRSKIDLIKKNAPEWTEVNERGQVCVVPGALASSVIKEYHGGAGLIYHQSTWWTYNAKKGVWQEENENGKRIKAFIQKKLGKRLSKKSIVEDVYFQVQNLCVQEELDFDFNKNTNMLNLHNGILDTETLEFIDHDPGYGFTARINTIYDNTAKCPRWMRFLEETELNKYTIKRLQEWFGYCLIPDCRIEKALFFKGPGRNGKTVIVETLQTLLKDYSSSLDVSQIFDRFNTARLRNKLVNICSDNNTNFCLDDRVKNLISGGVMPGEFKGKDGFDFTNFARLVFAANDFIPTKDKSLGFYSRFDIIYMPKVVAKEDIDKGLKKYLWENELPGILNWALEGLQRLKQNDFNMTESPELIENLEEFKEASNPLLQFVKEACKVEYDADCQIISSKLYAVYQTWCASTGHKQMTLSSMTRELKKIDARIDTVRKRHDGRKWQYYTNIKLVSVEEEFNYTPEEEKESEPQQEQGEMWEGNNSG